MAVIIPKNKRKKSNFFANNSFFAVIFFAVVLPCLVLKGVTTSQNTSSKSSNTSNKTEVHSSTKSFNAQKQNIIQLTSPVMDTAGVLKKSSKQELNSFLLNLQDEYGVQIAVLTVKSLNGEDIESFSMRHAEAWKLGAKGVDNGALLTVSMEEKELRIETGYGTEGVLTDAICARIIRNVIIPSFKTGNYDKGILEGVKSMAGFIVSDSTLISNKIEENESTSVEDSFSTVIAIIIIFVFLLLCNWNRSGLFGRRYYTRSFGRSSSGPSFRGGGGSFGGGGASGRW